MDEWEAWRAVIAHLGDVIALGVVAAACMVATIVLDPGLPAAMCWVAAVFLLFRARRELKKHDPGDPDDPEEAR